VAGMAAAGACMEHRSKQSQVVMLYQSGGVQSAWVAWGW
jgi:hypothetical protein